jgi:hypothetical protein
MTEDEAKTKGCCGPVGCGHQDFERNTYIDVQNSSIGNTVMKTTAFPIGTRVCIGSACMAWRWIPRTRAGGVNEGYADIPASPTAGFCGLSGKP